MKTKFKSTLRAARDSFSGAVFAGVVLLITSSAQAQNLFVGDASGNIYEYTPGGARSTFASGLNGPWGLAFNSAGDLFVVEGGYSGNIYEFTPGGVESTFASGLSGPLGLAFQPVPEPSALGLLAVGATAFLVRRRRNLAADLNPNQKPSVPSNRNFRVIPRRLLAGLTVLAGCALAHGSTVSIVAPNGLTGTEGNIDNTYPFSVAETMRYQQVYAASQFGAIAAGGGMITGIAFRPDAVYGNAFTHTIANIGIDLSMTTAGPGGLSLTFANNVGANDTTVFNGSLTLSSAFTGPAGGPKNFDILIPLTTPFYYNPAAGNLLLDIRNFSSGNSGGNLISALDATSANPTLVGRVYAFDASATSAPNSFDEDTLGLVTQFTATPVPEPATWGLLCVVALLVGRRGIAKA
jgi:hypothetical protein